MKVLMINGSPRVGGNTELALREMTGELEKQGIEVDYVQVGAMDVRGCIACGRCRELGKCVFDDIVNELALRFEEADGLVVGSPVYTGSANGTIVSLLDRLFFSTPFDKTMKVGAAVVVARRGGTTATFDQLNKYFTIEAMPVVSSEYWNNVFGRAVGEAAQDAEGLYNMRVLGRNMAFLLKGIQLAKEQYGMPEKEAEHPRTHFIR